MTAREDYIPLRGSGWVYPACTDLPRLAPVIENSDLGLYSGVHVRHSMVPSSCQGKYQFHGLSVSPHNAHCGLTLRLSSGDYWGCNLALISVTTYRTAVVSCIIVVWFQNLQTEIDIPIPGARSASRMPVAPPRYVQAGGRFRYH